MRLVSSLVFGILMAFSSPFSSVRPQETESPKVIETTFPVYPPIASAAHASGTVVVDIEIDQDGKVASAKVSRGHPLLAGVSRNAALSWRFEAATGIRKVSLTFDFDASSCRGSNTTVSPYHLRIEPAPIVYRPPDTVSYIPPDSAEIMCPLHKTRLQRDRVEIVYGLIGFQRGYEKAQKKLFPEANSEVFGGCVIETQINCDGTQIQSSPKYAEVLFCAKCRRAQAEWNRKHRPAQAKSD
jgi:TonB family protein